jgi:glycosyltransferase involved in cell wall biosynthesis
VYVTGAVADVRPYIGHARLVVAPLRVARGVQNKVLEAMAMARPVLMTSAARSGLETDPLCDSLVAHDAHVFAERTLAYLDDHVSPDIGERCRRYVERHYDWARNLEGLAVLLGAHAEVQPAMAKAI